MKERLHRFLFSNTSERQAVARNGFWRFASSGFSKVVRLGIVLFVAKQLGAAQFGVYAYALSIASLCFMFADWGMNAILVREVSRGSEGGAQAAFAVKLISNGLSAIAGVVVFFAMGGATGVGLILVAALFLSNMNDAVVSVYIGRQRSELEFAVSMAEVSLLSASIAYLWLHGSLSVVTFVGSVAVASVGSCIAGLLILSIVLRFKLGHVSWASLRGFMLQGLPMAWFGLIGYAFFSSDQLFLKHYFDFALVGQYALATRVVYASLILPGIVTSVALPLFVRSSSDIRRQRAVFRGGIAAMAACSLLVICSIALFGPWLASFLEDGYAETLPLMLKLACIAIPMFILVWLDNVLVMLGLQWKNLGVTMAAVILNELLNFLWVPSHGVNGALAATAISQGLNMLATFGIVAKRLCLPRAA